MFSVFAMDTIMIGIVTGVSPDAYLMLFLSTEQRFFGVFKPVL